MSLLEEKANKVMTNAQGSMPTVLIDPVTIMAVISIITQVVKLYQSCSQTPVEAKAAMSNPWFFNRWRLRRMVRKTLAANHSDQSVSAVMDGLLAEGKALTIEDVEKLYEEAK